MKQRVKGSAFAALRLFAIYGAGSLACSGPRPDATVQLDDPNSSQQTTPLDPASPGAAVVCDVSETPAGVEPEIYMLSAINHKLRAYPALAAAAGTDLVSDCDGARAYMKAYLDYAAANPDFDAEEPLAPASDDETPPPSTPTTDSPPETQKIYNGGDAKNNAVAHIVYNYTTGSVDPSFAGLRGTGATCSGTFIAKNWILTAAHCVTAGAVDDCMRRGRSRTTCDPRWGYWGEWEISGTKGPDQRFWTRRTVARGYIHPNWPGRTWENNPAFCPPSGAGGGGGSGGSGSGGGSGGATGGATCYARPVGAETDLALLYVPDDTALPGWIEEDGAARLSIVNPTTALWDFSMWGWGFTAPSVPGAPQEMLSLHTNTFQHPLPNLSVGSTIVGTIPSADRSFPCTGDSGGPLMRNSVPILTNLGSASVQAIVGVLSYGVTNCDFPSSSGGWFWTRVDPMTDRGTERVNYQFIRETLGRWPSNRGPFQCTGRKIVSGSPPAEMGSPVVDECWGTSCAGDDCPKGQYCSHPGREYAAYHGNQCPNCDETDFDCSCIIGQCLPSK